MRLVFTMQNDKLNNPAINRRKHLRNKIEFDTVMVFDLETAECLGRMENLTMGGFLLKSDSPLTIDKVHRISMSFPDLINQKSVFRCLAKSLWGDEIMSLWENNANTPDYYWTGFEFLIMNENDTKTVELLIDQIETPR